jgi:hypothetical protein
MSNPLAIAAVTATMRNLLTRGIRADPDLDDTTVTMLPVDLARPDGAVANQLNVFLYHMLPSPAWRNMDMPTRVRSGETGVPPLALNLYYLITAYGRNNDATLPFSHQLLGRAMSVLMDHPLLGADEIKAALPNNDLWQQIERIRFTLQPLPQDDLSKLWTGFQTGFRLSMAYEATVVLIESGASVKAPLPVLTRRFDDGGPTIQPSLAPPYPTLTNLVLPHPQAYLLPGETLVLQGSQLRGDGATVNFANPNLNVPIAVPVVLPGTEDQISVVIPDAPANWVAGFYTITVTVTRNGAPDANKDPANRAPFNQARTTNALSVALAPRITSALPLVVRAAAGVTQVTVQSKPDLRPGQRVALMLDDREIAASDRAAQSNQTTFDVPNATANTSFRMRLRVDGVDSPIIDWAQTPPAFDDNSRVNFQ